MPGVKELMSKLGAVTAKPGLGTTEQLCFSFTLQHPLEGNQKPGFNHPGCGMGREEWRMRKTQRTVGTRAQSVTVKTRSGTVIQ